jgi:hypothetical protein
MTRVYHLWLSTYISSSSAPAGNPVVPVIPATLTTSNQNQITWQIDWDSFFKGENKKYKRCNLRLKLNSESWTAAAGDWELYNGVLTCNLASNSVGVTTFGTPLALFSPIDCPTTSTTIHCIQIDTLANVFGTGVIVPTGNSYFTLSWYKQSFLELLGAAVYDYQVLLQFELYDPIEPTATF